MKTETIYRSHSIYRDDYDVEGYVFGEGEESVCVIAGMRGNEFQQVFTCARLIKALKKIEEEGALNPGHKILIIPCANPYSMNMGKRFWPIDNTDINRMFPGYVEGETTQRIAGGIFEKIKGYKYGIHLPSNYIPGKMMQGISIMKTGLEDPEKASEFGFPYVLLRTPRPYDTTTLNYNWQIWESTAFSLYVLTTRTIDEGVAEKAVVGMLSFMNARGILSYRGPIGYRSRIIDDSKLIHIRTSSAGFVSMNVDIGDVALKGTLLARVTNPMNGEILEELKASEDGVVFFLHAGPLLYAHTDTVRLVPLL